MQRIFRYIFAVMLPITVLVFTGCKSTRRVPEGEHMLVSNEINIDGSDLKNSEIKRLIRQKPNKRIAGLFRFNLFVWNLFDGEKLEKRNEKKREKLEKKNEEREGEGKDPKEFKPVLGYRIKHNVGEEPVLVDSSQITRSHENIERYLKNNGFFNAEADFEIQYNEKRKKAEVHYNIKTHEPYRIAEVAYAIEDRNILEDVNKVVQGTLLKNGEIFKMTDVDKERERLTEAMRNRGYFYFNRNYITYEVDSTIGNHRVFIRQMINSPKERERTPQGKDTIVVKQHEKYRINNVYIDPYYSTEFETDREDTLVYKDITFFNRSKLLFSPQVITAALFIRPGDLYKQSNQEYTYNRLSSLRNFRFINISFEESPGDTNAIDCYITLTPVVRQAGAAELEGTNTGGNLGISGNLSYTNRNTFGAAEVLNIRLKGGLEAQQTNAPDDDDEAAESERSRIDEYTPFNTIEYGLETSISLPDLFVPKDVSGIKIPKYNDPRTALNLGYTFQNRPDFTRDFFSGSVGYYWSGTSRIQNDFSFYPLQVNVIRISKRPFFQRRLDELNNEFLNNTYSNHLIAGFKFNFTRSNQNIRKKSHSYWNRIFVETAGNGLTLANNTLGSAKVDDNHYEMFGVRYAQFVKVSNDLRLYRVINESSKMVYRMYTGLGIPYDNLNVLPFDKSFFLGGANDMRGWVARSLGPGSAPSEGVNQVGDILLEFNAEYRVKFTNMVELGLFTDVGNIWLVDRPNIDPRAVFSLDRFYKEFAVSPGVGIRLDFSFLLIRVDWAFQMRDPALPDGERWYFSPKTQYNEQTGTEYSLRNTLNFGIGYPF